MPISFTQLTGAATLEGSLRWQVRHSILAAEYCLERAQEAVYSLLRVREMVTRATGTILTGASTITLPTRMLEPISVWRTGEWKGEINLLDQQHFEERLGEDDTSTPYEGTPTEATYDATTLYLNTKADQDYAYRVWYIGAPALMTALAPSNSVTDRYGHIIEAMALHYAWADRQDNDAKANAALEKAMGFITKANEEADMFRQSIRTEAYWSN